MSVVPNTLPKCTRTVVIDLLFMRKYSLTKTQMLVLYYLILLKNWAKVVDNYYVILSKKIEDDLKLHPKTVEATITQLKKLNLIDTKRVKVEEWNKNRTYRAIAVTELGKEYNLSFYKEDHYQHAKELEKENEDYRVENSRLSDKNIELESQNRELELKVKSLEIQLEIDERLTKTSLEAVEKNKELEEKYLALEIENRKLKNELEKQKSTKVEEIEDIDKFRKKVTKEYGQSGKAICNGVSNIDKWAMDTKFYINSYSRLSIYLNNGKLRQISDPKQINNFWEWLYNHQYRVGKLLNTKKVADISNLIPFIGKTLIIYGKPYKIKKLIAVVGGVKLFVLDSNDNLVFFRNSFKGDIIDTKKCKELFDLYVTIPKKRKKSEKNTLWSK